MSQDDCCHRLASVNRLIADARARVDAVKAMVLERPDCGSTVQLLRVLDRSLRLMIQFRAMLIKQRMSRPLYT